MERLQIIDRQLLNMNKCEGSMNSYDSFIWTMKTESPFEFIQNVGNLKGKTIVISGASRGIGLAIGLRCARDGANIVILAKTAETHSKLPGTIFTAAEQINKAGGNALPIQCDIRDEKQVLNAIDLIIKQFNSIDILVNNASAIALLDTQNMPMKRSYFIYYQLFYYI